MSSFLASISPLRRLHPFISIAVRILHGESSLLSSFFHHRNQQSPPPSYTSSKFKDTIPSSSLFAANFIFSGEIDFPAATTKKPVHENHPNPPQLLL
ncbi:hypothetical protein RDI58_016102 [Solanum bulbocastanum]|uniref:Uncharacterized protein n=1 Tax=Solanum bulbocastanum TaxID=147425 RepID=A0AAN8TLR8_SOLBU